MHFLHVLRILIKRGQFSVIKFIISAFNECDIYDEEIDFLKIEQTFKVDFQRDIDIVTISRFEGQWRAAGLQLAHASVAAVLAVVSCRGLSCEQLFGL